MARKPNYNFERSQRERAKAEKKAARQAAKTEKAEARKAATDEGAGEGAGGGEVANEAGEASE